MTDQQRGSEAPAGRTPNDSDPQMTVSVDFEAATPHSADAVAHVSVQDASHQGVRAFFDYLVPDQQRQIELVGFSVQLLQGERPAGAARFGPGAIKDMPLARWDRIAQAAVTQAVLQRSLAAVSIPLEPGEYQRLVENGLLNGPEFPDEEIATPLHVPLDRRQRAIETVRRVRPDLDPEESRGAARSWNGLVKLAEAMDEYTERLASGSADVVSEMAEAHGVAPATVRTWVHRANQAGITATGWLDSSANSIVPAYIRASGEPYPASEEAKASGPDPADVARFGPMPSRVSNRPRLTPRQAAFQELGRSFLAARERSGITLKDARKVIGLDSSVINAIDRGDFDSFNDEEGLREFMRVYSTALGFTPAGHWRTYINAKKLPDVLDEA
ncbi:helix-turn-helix domain-containing protein [Streptomyces griseorubiginosus]|uniref:helix-turn-helix domain-containing protein n=1 Tax=Streptomyces griseorubiginosus TaxID=67304 RepID=UPI002E820591|nr:helix-turn-helix domain-containing protein [Streptomyces griseorubiginosus]WUB45293.1 helix-turn-helix domain-containing protein [Streptomyces griseorubiginosus]WUB53810.1 helix-turn-helix domain-containing protein [Streptomyces griseorubiginosus]